MAAAAGLVWVTLLMCVALGAGQLDRASIQEALVAAFFPEGSLPPPVRIYCREDAALNVGIDGNNNVVLVNADCSDLSQKWFPVYIRSSLDNGEIERKPFFLMNAQTSQVITIPTWSRSTGQKVGLSSPPTNLLLVNTWLQEASKQLWTPEKPTRTDGFYKLIVTNDEDASLNGLWGGVKVGTEVGIYYSSANSDNAVWKLTSSITNCYP
ncbi:hypothetical protein D1007_16863 [Hordeum vulgare]|nr:hypothetical protein D1007_16863 [Hordeum vulgare]